MYENKFATRRPDEMNRRLRNLAAGDFHQPDCAGAVGRVIGGLEIDRDEIHFAPFRLRRDVSAAVANRTILRSPVIEPTRLDAPAVWEMRIA
jgi:hypothetical protein